MTARAVSEDPGFPSASLAPSGRLTMSRQFVSFCGHSGAGKKTLIGRLIADDPPGLRERFRILGTVGAYALPDSPENLS